MKDNEYTVIKADYIFSNTIKSHAKKYMLLKNGIIEHVSDRPPDNGGKRRLDFTGHVICPFFCDYHVHFFETVLVSADKIAGDLFQKGIRTVFEGGDRHLSGLKIKKILKNRLEVKTAGYAIYKKNTYGKFIGKGVEGFSEARALIDNLCEQGVDYIKVINSGSYRPETATITSGGFEKNALSEIVGYSRERGLDVFCHANGRENIHDAVSAGVSAVIHGLQVHDETLDMMAEKGIGFIPTVNAFAGLSRITDRAVQMNIGEVVEKHLLAIKKASDRGVKVLPGSDAGAYLIPYGKAYHEELGLFKKAGLSDEQILSSACVEQITEGMPADFLILDGLKVEKVFISGDCFIEMEDAL